MLITAAQDMMMMVDHGIESAMAVIDMNQGKSIEQCIIQFSLNCTLDPLEK